MDLRLIGSYTVEMTAELLKEAGYVWISVSQIFCVFPLRFSGSYSVRGILSFANLGNL